MKQHEAIYLSNLKKEKEDKMKTNKEIFSMDPKTEFSETQSRLKGAGYQPTWKSATFNKQYDCGPIIALNFSAIEDGVGIEDKYEGSYMEVTFEMIEIMYAYMVERGKVK